MNGTPSATAKFREACAAASTTGPDATAPARRDPRNLEDRIIEAKREGWLGEVEGLQVSYSGVKDKLAQLDAMLSGLARNFGDVFVGPLCGGREGGVFVGGDALE